MTFPSNSGSRNTSGRWRRNTSTATSCVSEPNWRRPNSCLAGVTTTTDMYFFADEVCSVLAEAGMRGVIAESLIGFPTPRCATSDEMLEKQRDLIEAYRKHPLILPSVAAHSPYSVSAKDLVREAELAEEFGVPMQIHLSETSWEVEKLLEEKGVSPVAYLADLGVLSDRTVAAHCVHVSPEDIDTPRRVRGRGGAQSGQQPQARIRVSHRCPRWSRPVSRSVSGPTAPPPTTPSISCATCRLRPSSTRESPGDPTVLPARTMIEMATSEGARGPRALRPDREPDRGTRGGPRYVIKVDGPHTAPDVRPVFASRLCRSGRGRAPRCDSRPHRRPQSRAPDP